MGDSMGQIIWTRNFLTAQGYDVTENVVYQDNKSAILLEQNGTISSLKRTRHINASFYFIKDRIATKEMDVQYCPADEMLLIFLPSHSKEKKFLEFRDKIMGTKHQE